jgi:hypothetical protein
MAQEVIANIILILFLVIGAYLFFIVAKKVSVYAVALIFDYVGDLLCSLIDTVFGGVAGLDWGDWIIAVVIYGYYVGKVGNGWAIFGALEAANPLALIPGVGPFIGLVTDLMPTMTAIIAMKDISLSNQINKIVRRIEIIRSTGESTKGEEKILEKLQELQAKHNYVEAIPEAEAIAQALDGTVKAVIKARLIQDEKILVEELAQKKASGEAVISERALGEVRKLWEDVQMDLEEGDIDFAVDDLSAAEEQEQGLITGIQNKGKSIWQRVEDSFSTPKPLKDKDNEIFEQATKPQQVAQPTQARQNMNTRHRQTRQPPTTQRARATSVTEGKQIVKRRVETRIEENLKSSVEARFAKAKRGSGQGMVKRKPNKTTQPRPRTQ